MLLDDIYKIVNISILLFFKIFRSLNEVPSFTVDWEFANKCIFSYYP